MDEALHGSWYGRKYQKYTRKNLTKKERNELQEWTTEVLFLLYENEVKYTEDLYNGVGYTDDVKRYLRYRANVALGNLGMPAIFSETMADVNPAVITGIRTSSSNQDFFSQVGNSYLLGKVEAVSEDDYSMIKSLAQV